MTATRTANDLLDAIRIPTLPAAVERIRALLSSNEVELAKVVEAFLEDPPLAAKVLKTANSAAYGLREKTTSIHQAVALLGLRTLSMIVLRAGIVSAYSEGAEGFDLQDIWNHSTLTAHISEDLARRCRRRASDMSPHDYYTCGLLHDLGKIILYDNLGAEYADILREAKDEAELEDLEMRQLGVRHGDAGYMAAVLWKLPEPIPGIIRSHHRPETLTGQVEVAKIVSCADEIAHAIARAPESKPREVRALIQTVPGGLSEEQLLLGIASALESWKQIAA